MNGQQYRSVEHAYQAFKDPNPAGSAHQLIREAKSPAIAKRLGRSVQLQPDWDTTKIALMEQLIREKFKNPLLRSMLLATEDVTLIEGNTWGDITWGVCKGRGANHLGLILMKIREECRSEEISS